MPKLEAEPIGSSARANEVDLALRIGAIPANRFARMKSRRKQKTIFTTFNRFAGIASNPRFAIFSAPRRGLQKSRLAKLLKGAFWL